MLREIIEQVDEVIEVVPVQKSWLEMFLERGIIDSTTNNKGLIIRAAKKLLIEVNPYVKIIAIVICVGGLLFYITGVKKGMRYATGSFMGFTIYKVIVSVIL